MSNSAASSAAFEATIFDVLRIALRITFRDPRFATRAIRLLHRQRRAARVRRRHEASGLHVPPFVIYSITGRCNLRCAGCYANLLHQAPRPEVSDERVIGILREARDLGVSVMLLAGGEPLLRPRLLDFTEAFPEILFLLFTNGSLLTEEIVCRLRSQQHVVPVLSLEGGEAETDARRGAGTHRTVTRAMQRLHEGGVFFGTSTTLTRANFALVTGEPYISRMVRQGCKLFYYINYVPVAPGTEDLQLSPAQVSDLEARLTRHRQSLPAVFIAFPHDEIALGGCLAAGRGFLHINPYGDVEPCPFSPYSDRNLTEMSFAEGIGSPLLQRILRSGVVLDETDGQCALWKRRDWVARLLEEGASADAPGASPDALPGADRV